MRFFVSPIAALAIAAAISGCAETTSSLAPLQQPPPASTTSNRPATEKRHVRSASHKEAASRSEEGSTTPPGPPGSNLPATSVPGKQAAPATTVTLADEQAQKDHTEKLLNDSDVRLGKIDRSHLSADDASTYQQAQKLNLAARQALERRDYLMASGLAEKASVLAIMIGEKAR